MILVVELILFETVRNLLISSSLNLFLWYFPVILSIGICNALRMVFLIMRFILANPPSKIIHSVSDSLIGVHSFRSGIILSFKTESIGLLILIL